LEEAGVGSSILPLGIVIFYIDVWTNKYN